MVCGIMTTYFEIKEVDAMSVIMAYKTDDKIYLGADNRAVSMDSRTFGPVSKKQILGVSNFVLFPFNRFGKVK